MAENVTDEIKRLSEILARDPDSIVFASLAQLYLKQGMVNEAIKMCLSGLKKHPSYVKGHRVLAEAYLKNGMVHSAKGEYEKILELNPLDEEAKSKLESAFWEKREAEIPEPEEAPRPEDKAVEVSFAEGKVEEPMATPPEVEIEEEVSFPAEDAAAASLMKALETPSPAEEAETFMPKAEIEEEAEIPEGTAGQHEEGAEEVDLLFGRERAEPSLEPIAEQDAGFPLEEEPEREEFRPMPSEQKLDLSVEEEEEAPLGTPLQDEEIEKALSAGLMLEKRAPQRESVEERAAVASGLDALIRSFESIRKEHGAPSPQPRPSPEQKAEVVSSMSALDRTLNELLQKPGIKAALLIDPSGLVVESASDLQVDVEETAALVSSVFSASQKTMETLNLGKVDRIAVERGGTRVYITRAGEYMLMVESDSTMRLGLLMVMAKRTSRTIEELMR
jgi:predicted regulator of Ras-like GTPase activity (Roadblock/LC7/MglB family)/tetratricopeptide (TPR) repeat protein